MITIQLNSQSLQLPETATLATAIAKWQENTAQSQAMACAINGEFVPRSSYQSRQLLNGDQIDLVTPIGGG